MGKRKNKTKKPPQQWNGEHTNINFSCVVSAGKWMENEWIIIVGWLFVVWKSYANYKKKTS